MKIIFLVSFLSVCCVGVSQTIVEQKKYKNGNIQEERVFENQKLKIVTNYYKDGSLKTREYIDAGILEKYYKNGQMSYLKVNSDSSSIEESYSKKGLLILRLINNEIEFEAYEDIIEHEHKHEHKHDHHHGHHHGHHH